MIRKPKVAAKKAEKTKREPRDPGEIKLGNTGSITHLTADDLTERLSSMPIYHGFRFWIVGETPLITHAWSEKAKKEMLAKEMKAFKGSGKQARDPKADFESSLYPMGDGSYGFPVTGVKQAIWMVAHKDKGIPREGVKQALWLNAEIVSVRPALAGAICNMPLVRVYGSQPQMREDMVRVGSGIKKVATFAYRAEFRYWAILVTGQYGDDVLNKNSLLNLTEIGGIRMGVGEWRNGRSGGIMGRFRVANQKESQAWDDFKSGKTRIVPGSKPMKPTLVAAE